MFNDYRSEDNNTSIIWNILLSILAVILLGVVIFLFGGIVKDTFTKKSNTETQKVSTESNQNIGKNQEKKKSQNQSTENKNESTEKKETVSTESDKDADQNDDSPYAKAKKYIYSAESSILSYKGHAYLIFNYKDLKLDNYTDCVRCCEDMGGHLAVINDMDENEELYQLVKKTGLNLCFFGYTDESIEGNWKWVDGSDNTFTNWYQDEEDEDNSAPQEDNDRRNYAEFDKDASDGTWRDASFGSHTYRFICEWE